MWNLQKKFRLMACTTYSNLNYRAVQELVEKEAKLRLEFFFVQSLSEAFILTSTNPQYGKRLSIDLPVQYMKTTSSEHVVYTIVLNVKTICVRIMF